jgi:hypothetical protein
MILEQAYTFTYLEYKEEKDIHSKITKILQTLGLLNNTLKPNLVQRSKRLKLYKTPGRPLTKLLNDINTQDTTYNNQQLSPKQVNLATIYDGDDDDQFNITLRRLKPKITSTLVCSVANTV